MMNPPVNAEWAVQTQRLTRNFGATAAVRDVSVNIARGEIFGILGPDGAGKSTLIQMLCGILRPSAGAARVLGHDTVSDAGGITRRVGYMSQAFSLYGGLSVEENIRFFADLRGVPPTERRQRADRLLRFSRLAPFVRRAARDLSGGMQKKLALATVLVHAPDILFLDEPTTGVDPLSRRDFWELVFDFAGEGTTIVVATPYLDEAERCTRVGLMYDGALLEVASPAELKRRLGGQMAEIWTADQGAALDRLRSDPDVRSAEIFGRVIHAHLSDMAAYRNVEARLRAAAVPVEAARCIEPSLEDVFVARIPAVPRLGLTDQGTETRAFRFRDAPTPRPSALAAETPAIEAEALTRRFGNFLAVDGVSFRVHAGEVFGFLGPNGSGKSTTIRMLMGILRPTAGRARVLGVDIPRHARNVRPWLGYMSQRFSLHGDLTVRENLDYYAGLYGIPARDHETRRDWALRTVGFDAPPTQRTGELSGGWKQRLALAAAIQHHPRLLLLDEPTSGVDPVSRRQFWDVIFALARRGVTVLVTTHYMDEAERCERVALLNVGRIAALGTPAELRAGVGGWMLELELERPMQGLKLAREIPGVLQVALYGMRLRLRLNDRLLGERVRTRLAEAGLQVGATAEVPLGMEDVFAAVIEPGSGGPAAGAFA